MMPSSTELCGSMAHQGLKQHIDLSTGRLSTYKALREEFINHSRARRTWTDPNAMQVDAVHVNVNQNDNSMGVAHAQTSTKAAKATNASPRRRQRQKRANAVTKFDGECRYCMKKRHKKSDCRKMKSDIVASNVTRVASQLASMHSERQAQRSLHRQRTTHRAWLAPFHCNRWCQCTSKVLTALGRLNRRRRGTSS